MMNMIWLLLDALHSHWQFVEIELFDKSVKNCHRRKKSAYIYLQIIMNRSKSFYTTNCSFLVAQNLFNSLSEAQMKTKSTDAHFPSIQVNYMILRCGLSKDLVWCFSKDKEKLLLLNYVQRILQEILFICSILYISWCCDWEALNILAAGSIWAIFTIL